MGAFAAAPSERRDEGSRPILGQPKTKDAALEKTRAPRRPYAVWRACHRHVALLAGEPEMASTSKAAASESAVLRRNQREQSKVSSLWKSGSQMEWRSTLYPSLEHPLPARQIYLAAAAPWRHGAGAPPRSESPAQLLARQPWTRSHRFPPARRSRKTSDVCRPARPA